VQQNITKLRELELLSKEPNSPLREAKLKLLLPEDNLPEIGVTHLLVDKFPIDANNLGDKV
jgi:hypothetical protein